MSKIDWSKYDPNEIVSALGKSASKEVKKIEEAEQARRDAALKETAAAMGLSEKDFLRKLFGEEISTKANIVPRRKVTTKNKRRCWVIRRKLGQLNKSHALARLDGESGQARECTYTNNLTSRPNILKLIK